MGKLAFKITLLCVLLMAIKLPWEEKIQDLHPPSKAGAQLTVDLRSKLGQNFAIAVLSGFRGLVADFIWLRAHAAWEDNQWYKMKEGLDLAVILQPHSISFWDIGAWHMAWNASVHERRNKAYATEAYRIKAERDWILAGKKYLENGIRNNPENWELYFAMTRLIDWKLKDPIEAAPYAIKAASFPQAPLYVGRQVGLLYQKAAENAEDLKEKEKWTRAAYEWWKSLWLQNHALQPNQDWNKIERWGRECEEQLKIPAAERVFPSKPISTNLKISR